MESTDKTVHNTLNLGSENKWENISQWVLAISIFLPIPSDMCCLILVTLLLLFRGKFHVAVKPLLLMLGVGVISMLTILYLGYPYSKFLQQFALVTLYILFGINFFYFNRENLEEIFRKYCQVSMWVAIGGLIQMAIWELSHKNIFNFIFRDTGRLTSFLMAEPGRLACVLLPAFVYYLFSSGWKKYLPQKIVLLSAILLTDSFAVFILLPFVFILRLCYSRQRGIIKWRFGIAVVVIVLSLSSILTYVRQGEWSSSSNRTFYMLKNGLELISDPSVDIIDRQTLSVYAFSKNFWVAVNSPCRIFGTGLGTHEYNHDAIYFSNNKFYFLNREDGYSLLNRVFSEFGYVGLLIVAICFVRWYNPRNPINIAVGFLLISYFIRGGHYVANGTVYFIIIYYLSSTKFYNRSEGDGGKNNTVS